MMCKPRFSLPGGWQKDLPSLFAGIPKRHEVSHHGHEHERSDRLAAEEQLSWIEKATEVPQKVTGTGPPGFTTRDFRLRPGRSLPFWSNVGMPTMPPRQVTGASPSRSEASAPHREIPTPGNNLECDVMPFGAGTCLLRVRHM